MNSKRFLTLLFILFFVWMIFTQFFASREILRAIDAYDIDKAFHFLGGVWVVGILSSFLCLRQRGFAIAVLLFIVGIAWEIIELAVFPEVRHLFRDLYPYWLSDTAGDIVIDMLGGVFALFWITSEKNMFDA